MVNIANGIEFRKIWTNLGWGNYRLFVFLLFRIIEAASLLLQRFQPSRFSRKPPVFRDRFRPPVSASRPPVFMFSSKKSQICYKFSGMLSINSKKNASLLQQLKKLDKTVKCLT